MRFGGANSVFTNSYAWFNLSNGTKGTIESGITADIEDYGNGWYRLIATRTSAATNTGRFFWGLANDNGSTNYTGDGSSSVYAYGFQAEAGSYATSYIPTYGTSVTRDADACNGAGNTATFNSTEGVLYAEISALDDDGTFRLISLSDGTTNNRLSLGYRSTSNAIYCEIRNANVTQAFLLGIVSDIKNKHKVAVKYKENDFSLWINGVEVATDNSGITPLNLSKLNFDSGQQTGGIFFGKTNQVLVFPTALSDTELATLTTI